MKDFLKDCGIVYGIILAVLVLLVSIELMPVLIPALILVGLLFVVKESYELWGKNERLL